MKPKIINIMSQPPAYGLFRHGPRPEVIWNANSERWFGIWGLDWLDLVGKAILRQTKEFDFEVWQPDLRVNKIYSHAFPDGLVHKLFPARLKIKRNGIKKTYCAVSQAMCGNLLEEINVGRIILRVGSPSSLLNRDILSLTLDCPVILQYFGEFRSPMQSIFRLKKNLIAKFDDIQDHFTLRSFLDKCDIVTYTAEFSKRGLLKYYNGDLISLSIGIDFDQWESRINKLDARKRLRLDNKKFTLLSSSRLNGLKQVDKVIEILRKLREHSFMFIVTGHGDEKYERFLHALGEPLVQQGKLRFTGHVSDERLMWLYNAADLFVMSSYSEAGPTSTIKALAMEVPVFSTNTGQMAELLCNNDAGIVVPRRAYRVWERELRAIMSGKKVRTLDRNIVKSIYDWPIVAEQYIDLYRKLYMQYYG